MTNRFEGWYFKQQSGKNILAVIPAVHSGRGSTPMGSVQVITPDQSYFIEVPRKQVIITRRPLAVTVGESVLSANGLTLNLQSDGIRITGCLRYGKLTPPKGDIMGPYRLVPFMECRHSVFSLTHTVEGSLTVNGKHLDFSGGTGYMEGDRGRSFPKRYIWTQCSWFNDSQPCALMLSAAEVKPLGIPFTGIIGFVYFRGRELRMATYRGAKIVSAGSGTVSVSQGVFSLTAQLLDSSDQSLRAPDSGRMTRLIKESLSCRARYTFKENNNVIFDFVTDKASFEYEY